MAVIAPALLAENADSYKQQAEKLNVFAERVHVDISDGIFAPNFTVDEGQVWWPQNWKVDIHAMVDKPSEHIQKLVSLRPNLIILHAECHEDISQIIQYIKQNGVKAGIALQKQTVPSTVEPLISMVDHVMIFSGDLGRYGGTASMMQLEKVRLVKRINAAVEIGWDGGVNVQNAFTLSQGGVDVLNVGGTIAKSDNPEETYKQLVAEINKQGVL